MVMMYKIIIETKYNVINLLVYTYNNKTIQEIIEQPYVINVGIRKIDENMLSDGDESRIIGGNNGKTKKLTPKHGGTLQNGGGNYEKKTK